MKKFFLAAIILYLFYPQLIFSQNDSTFSLKLVSPSQNGSINYIGKPFYINGVVSPPNSNLTINGTEAEVDKDGAFIAFAKINLFIDNGKTKGKFVFNITSSSGNKKIERIFSVNPIVETSSADTLIIDSLWTIKPAVNTSLEIGDYLPVELKASPNSQVYFNITGYNRNFPMVESRQINTYFWGDAVFGEGFKGLHDTVGGVYKGGLYITKSLNNAEIKISVIKNGDTLTTTAPGKISTMNNATPVIVKTRSEPNLIVGRYGPGKGYKLFLNGGIKLEETGKYGNWLKCKLSKVDNIFIPAYSAEQLPTGSQIPHASIYAIRAQDSARFTSINLGLSDRCAYKIIEHNSPQRIELLVYNVTSNIDWIFYDKKSSFIKRIKWDQPKDNILKVMIYLNEKTHWGFSTKYEGNTLVLNIKKPAKRNGGFLFWSNQLKNRVIVLDPGHNPETGAIGGRGTLERDVNLKITLQLKKMLEDAGAKVYLTHTTNPLPLRQRKSVVNSFHPDISVSIHNNAVPQGVNPIKHNGSSVYYYYAQAKPLAELIHKNFIKNLELNDFGLYWDNLYMSRIPESISLLVEPAFMIMPKQERLLRTKEFRAKIAKSIFDAIDEFYEEYSQ